MDSFHTKNKRFFKPLTHQWKLSIGQKFISEKRFLIHTKTKIVLLRTTHWKVLGEHKKKESYF